MKRRTVNRKGLLKGKLGYEADYIEKIIEKRMTGEDLILGGKGVMYTERKDGVLVASNIRTDRFHEAMMQMDGIERTRIARGEEYAKKAKEAAEAAKEASNKASGADQKTEK